MMAHDELSISYQYYILYANESEKATQSSSPHSAVLSGRQRLDSDNVTQLEEDTPLDQFWKDFEWTKEEKTLKKKELDQNLAKCDLVENLPPGRGQFLIRQYDQEAESYWNKFYSSHHTNFFKDRHYLHKTFPHEFGPLYGTHCIDSSGDATESYQSDRGSANSTNNLDFTIVEIGCGVGNTVLPLLELESIIQPSPTIEEGSQELVQQTKRLVVWGLDFSETALNLMREDARFVKAQQENSRARAAVWDITKTHPKDISQELDASANISLLLFCLSAISPEKMPQAARNVASTLKPGGMLLLRDYGRYDEAQLKLGKSRAKRIGENFYAKHDGTRCYYFDLEDLEELFGNGNRGAGLEVVELKYIQRLYTNRSKDVVRRRIWVQGRFRKV